MAKENGIMSSVYRKVAVDIAQNIAAGRYAEGQRLYGRSVLASQYGVSPETIRKAVHILKDMGIVDTEKGSGVEVKSTEKAREFMRLQQEVARISSVKGELIAWATRQAEELAGLIDRVQILSAAAERVRHADHFTPYALVITETSIALGKTVDELRFWHNTEGTIIAIRRDDQLILSPGPYADFRLGDVFYMIGSEKAYACAQTLLFGQGAQG